ncbi:MAG: hypothetical protein B7X53_11975 [Hyphomonas sp. 34-62-18]|nr:IS66 family insertion sequence element accessory protein TnpB [Hyphomonas sp. 34-62-18]OZB15233.1 MAG: hypothetical protein B7X53_11975 [Hyphomonas sp. 34-62-18]
MIGPGTGVRVYLACGVTDMRKGIEGLAALAQDHLRQKVLEKGRFPWPARGDGAARLTSAQLAMLWEGIDWRRPDWGAPPARVG